MKAKEYIILEECVENGVAFGVRRAYKYLAEGQEPSEQHLQQTVVTEVMNAIDEKFQFEGASLEESMERLVVILESR